MSQEISTPPSGVGISVVESSDSRLVIAVPPGGKKARGIGCFAFAWLAITVPVSCVFLLVDDANWEGGEAPPLFVMIPFFGIFWAVGIGMLIAWVRMRFTQTYLAVEPAQFAIQKTVFGRKKLKKIPLDQNSHAELVESYSENDVPVYAIQVEGIGETEKFGTRLSYPEKRWLATTINQFLGVDGRSSSEGTGASSLPDYCGDCGSELIAGDGKRVCSDCGRVYLEGDSDSDSDAESGRDFSAATDPRGSVSKIIERPPAIDPYDLPADSKIRIDLDDGETLAFSYAIQVPLGIKLVAGTFLTFFCCAWYGGVVTFIVTAVSGDEPLPVKIGITAFASLFLFFGLMPLGSLLAIFFGRAWLSMSRDKVTGAIGFWFLRKKKAISTSSITDVGLTTTTFSSRRMRSRQFNSSTRTSSVFSGQKGCMIQSSEFNMPLTMSSDMQFNEQVAGLARFQLKRLGVDLADD